MDTEQAFAMQEQAVANVHPIQTHLTEAWEYKEAHIDQGKQRKTNVDAVLHRN